MDDIIFTLRQNKIDSDMVEFYTDVRGCTYLVCVMHEDCLSESNLIDILDEEGSVKVRMEAIK